MPLPKPCVHYGQKCHNQLYRFFNIASRVQLIGKKLAIVATWENLLGLIFAVNDFFPIDLELICHVNAGHDSCC